MLLTIFTAKPIVPAATEPQKSEIGIFLMRLKFCMRLDSNAIEPLPNFEGNEDFNEQFRRMRYLKMAHLISDGHGSKPVLSLQWEFLFW